MKNKFLYRYFVDRDEELGKLDLAVQDPDTRLIWIVGEFGIGKTKIMNEFKAKLLKQRARLVHIDLNKSKGKLGYMFVITEIRNDLGRKGFEPINEAILELNPSKKPDYELTPAQKEQLEEIFANLPKEGGGIDFREKTTIEDSEIAGHSILKFFNYYADQRDQNRIEEEISLILRDCLFEASKDQRLVFIIDHWEEANGELQEWLTQYLLAWCLDQPDFNAFAVIGCEELPEWYEARFDVEEMPIEEFPEDIVRFYWVTVRELPVESFNQQDVSVLRNPTTLSKHAKSVKDQLDQQKK